MSMLWDRDSNMICPKCGTLICKILNPVYSQDRVRRTDYFIYKFKSLPVSGSDMRDSFECCRCGYAPFTCYNPKSYLVFKIV